LISGSLYECYRVYLFCLNLTINQIVFFRWETCKSLAFKQISNQIISLDQKENEPSPSEQVLNIRAQFQQLQSFGHSIEEIEEEGKRCHQRTHADPVAIPDSVKQQSELKKAETFLSANFPLETAIPEKNWKWMTIQNLIQILMIS